MLKQKEKRMSLGKIKKIKLKLIWLFVGTLCLRLNGIKTIYCVSYYLSINYHSETIHWSVTARNYNHSSSLNIIIYNS
jgi:hypothetical protein